MRSNRNRLQYIITYIILAVFTIGALLNSVLIITAAADPKPTEIAVIEETIDINTLQNIYFQDIQYYECTTSAEALAEITRINAYITQLRNCVLEIPAVNEIFIVEIERMQQLKTAYKTVYTDLYAYEEKWAKRAEEYPIATYVWLYMKNNFGWSDVVCAGVMGNIMGEIGRDMKFEKWNHKIPYGMFQWLGGRRKDIHRIYGEEPTIDEQLEFMFDELYGTDGVRKQVTNKQRDAILNGKTPEEVAMAFCRYFERPGGTGLCRKGYARKAYEYFKD